MVKRERERELVTKRLKQTDTTAVIVAGTYSTVFIDTSLDTHLATIVSNSDTVSDLKAKILLEHLQCFPKIGEIKIHALKVKRKGNFYHLSESMLVSSAFEASKKNWFVSVDASSLKQNDNQNSCRSEASNPLALVCFQPNPSGESSLKKLGSTHCTNQKLLDTHDSTSKESRDVNDEVKDAATNQRDKNSQSVESEHAVKNTWKTNKQDDVAVLDRSLKDQVASTNSVVAAAREASNDIEMANKDVYDEDLDSRPAAKKKRKTESTESSKNPSYYKRRKYSNDELLVARVEKDRIFNENVDHEDSSKEKHIEPVQEMAEMSKVTPPLIGSDMCETDAVNAKGNSDVAAGINGKRTKTTKRVKKTKISNQDLRGIDQAKDSAGEIALPVAQFGVDDHFDVESKSKQVSEQKPVDGSSSGAVKEDNIIEHLPQAKVVEVESGKVGETKKKTVRKVKKSAAGISKTATNSIINGDSVNLVKKDESFLSRIEEVVEASLQQNPVNTSLVASDKELSSMNGHHEMDSLPLTQPNSKNDVDVDENSGTDMHESNAVNAEGNIDVAGSSKKSKNRKRVKKVEVSNHDLHGIDQANESAGEISLPIVQFGNDNHFDVESKSKQVSEKNPVDGSSSGAVKEDNMIEDLHQGNDNNIDNTDFENKEPLAVSAKPVEVEMGKVCEIKKKKKKVKKSADVISQTANDSVINGDSVNLVKKNESFLSRIEGVVEVSLQQNPVDISSMASDKEPSSMNAQHEIDSLPLTQPNSKSDVDEKSGKKLNEDEKIQDAVDMVSKSKKKTRKKQNSETKSRLGLAVNEVTVHELTALDDKQKDTDPPFITSNKPKIDKIEAENEIDFKNYFVSEQEDKKVISEVKKKGSKQEKSLLVTPRAIFSDDSSGDSSGDEKKNVNSGTSTRTPSSSSGSSIDSIRNERKEGGKNITILPKSTGLKNITMDMIFRSSRRFKKAKLTALEDSESQPVEFVPDSQPNV